MKMPGAALCGSGYSSKLHPCAGSVQQQRTLWCSSLPDAPCLASCTALCTAHRPLQVTNPPIDPLREGLVMSLEMRLGGRGNLLQTSEGE